MCFLFSCFILSNPSFAKEKDCKYNFTVTGLIYDLIEALKKHVVQKFEIRLTFLLYYSSRSKNKTVSFHNSSYIHQNTMYNWSWRDQDSALLSLVDTPSITFLSSEFKFPSPDVINNVVHSNFWQTFVTCMESMLISEVRKVGGPLIEFSKMVDYVGSSYNPPTAEYVGCLYWDLNDLCLKDFCFCFFKYLLYLK